MFYARTTIKGDRNVPMLKYIGWTCICSRSAFHLPNVVADAGGLRKQSPGKSEAQHGERHHEIAHVAVFMTRTTRSMKTIASDVPCQGAINSSSFFLLSQGITSLGQRCGRLLVCVCAQLTSPGNSHKLKLEMSAPIPSRWEHPEPQGCTQQNTHITPGEAKRETSRYAKRLHRLKS